MKEGNLGEVIARVVDQLCGGLPPAKTEDVTEIEAALRGDDLMTGVLGAEDEALIGRVRQSLVRIATALGAGQSDFQIRSVRVAIDGAEMASRGELLAGNARYLPRLLPSFVFMVALPIVEQDRALELSHRAAKLIDQELGPQQES